MADSPSVGLHRAPRHNPRPAAADRKPPHASRDHRQAERNGRVDATAAVARKARAARPHRPAAMRQDAAALDVPPDRMPPASPRDHSADGPHADARATSDVDEDEDETASAADDAPLRDAAKPTADLPCAPPRAGSSRAAERAAGLAAAFCRSFWSLVRSRPRGERSPSSPRESHTPDNWELCQPGATLLNRNTSVFPPSPDESHGNSSRYRAG